MVLIRFLHDFGYPWLLGVRTGIRMSSSHRLDFMWNLALPWFRASGKTNYGPMAVNVGLLNELMGPTFKKFWHSYRTASFLGRQGRNVAWDYVLERMNRDFKQFLGCCVTEARLESFAQMLNGLKHVKRMVSNT